MAISTLVTLYDEIEKFVKEHIQLKKVFFQADDQRANEIGQNEEFPILFVAPLDVQVGRALNSHTLRIYVYERMNKGEGDDDFLDNANDTSLILRDIRLWWNNYSDSEIEISDDILGIFVSNRELDNFVGYYSDVKFEVPAHGRCEIPINTTPKPPQTDHTGTTQMGIQPMSIRKN